MHWLNINAYIDLSSNVLILKYLKEQSQFSHLKSFPKLSVAYFYAHAFISKLNKSYLNQSFECSSVLYDCVVHK